MSLPTKIIIIGTGYSSFAENTFSAPPADEHQSIVTLISGPGRVISKNLYNLFVTPAE